MTPTETQFVTDEAGQRIAVLIGLDRYHQLLEAIEEIDAIQAYDNAKANGGEAIPFEDATREIERKRKAV
jgi:hypothetical protein